MSQLLSPKKLRHNWKFGADAPWKFNERYRAEAGKLSRRPLRGPSDFGNVKM